MKTIFATLIAAFLLVACGDPTAEPPPPPPPPAVPPPPPPPPPGPGPVTSVSINVDTARLAEAEQLQLVATARDAAGQVVTGRAVIWSTADPEVATVGALGLVTAVHPDTVDVSARVDGITGRATIIVRANYDYELVFAGWSGTAGVPFYLYQLDINREFHEPTQLSSELGVGNFAVAPDGLRFVVAGIKGGVRGLYLVDRDGSNPELLLADPDATQPAWSPDGAKIAFRRWPMGHGPDIWIIDVDGTGLTNLTLDHGATGQHTPTFSPLLEGGGGGGGYRIAYSHSPGPTAHIWTMKPDGSDKVQITSGDEFWDDAPAWSPDGTRIAFQRLAADIYVVPASGGNATPFVALPGSQLAPRWSPDGVLLAFASKGEAGNFEIFTVRADGTGALTRRTKDPLDKQEPAWLK